MWKCVAAAISGYQLCKAAGEAGQAREDRSGRRKVCPNERQGAPALSDERLAMVAVVSENVWRRS